MSENQNFDIDIALSADLDGALAEYAGELGTDEATVRARIAAEPGSVERRARLAVARDALRAPAPNLDEVTRARLVSEALGAPASATHREHRPRGWWLRAGAAAACAVLVIAGGIALVTQDDNDGRASKSAATGGRATRSGNIGDIGDIDQKKLDQLVGGPSAEAAAARSSTSGAPQSSGSGSSESRSSVSGFDADAAARARPDQVTQCTQNLGDQGTVRFNGSGAYKGEPAVIVGVAAGGRTVVFVVAADDCSRVLYSVSR